MSQALSVSLERKGTVIDVNYDTTALQNIHVDLNEVAEDDRSGSAKKLLGASVLYCYTAALDKALDVRGAKYDAIKGRATVTAGTDDKGRGRILGMEQNDGRQLIIAEVPQAEMFKYATDLRSMTQAKGSFKMSFERYEEVPQAISSKIIEAHKADLADDEE